MSLFRTLRLVKASTKYAKSNVFCRSPLETLKRFRHVSAVSSQVPEYQWSPEERSQFMSVLPEIIHELTHNDDPGLAEVEAWYTKVLKYNLPGGKLNRGQSVVSTYTHLAEQSKLTEEYMKLAYIMGWCVEMLQSFFLVADDLMDGSEMRRGIPCWFRTQNLATKALNDSLLIEGGVYAMLKKFYGQKPYYVDCVELFHTVTMHTVRGQALDLLLSGDHPNRDQEASRLKQFNIENYSTIVKYKTAYYSFVLPVALGMHMAGVKDKELHRLSEEILLKMGYFFQVQDDYLDFFGNPSVTGKIGTDIQEGKCSWLVVKALQKVNCDQREILNNCYGFKDAEKIAAIEKLYRELDLSAEYSRYQEESYSSLCQAVENLPSQTHNFRKLFFNFLRKIYKRNS